MNNVKYILIITLLLSLLPRWASAQETENKDTVIVNFGEKSSLLFYINDRKDLKALEQYDLNAIAKDLTEKLEITDSGEYVAESEDQFLKDSIQNEIDSVVEESTANKEEEHIDGRKLIKKYKTKHFFNIDIGLNNYLEKGKFPSDNDAAYTLSPWKSWYIAVGPTYKSQIAGKLFLEYGLNVSWHNFRFEKDDIRLEKTGLETRFVEEGLDVDYKKSKLTTTHINASLVPLLDFGKMKSLRKSSWKDWDDDDDYYKRGFRIGIGGYAGYKVGNYARYVVEIDGDKKKNKDKDSFYLNNWRYGARLQLGYRGTDLFINYDLSELFATGKGPALNAFSFGITL